MLDITSTLSTTGFNPPPPKKIIQEAGCSPKENMEPLEKVPGEPIRPRSECFSFAVGNGAQGLVSTALTQSGWRRFPPRSGRKDTPPRVARLDPEAGAKASLSNWVRLGETKNAPHKSQEL